MVVVLFKRLSSILVLSWTIAKEEHTGRAVLLLLLLVLVCLLRYAMV